MTAAEACRTPQFWLLWMVLCLNVSAGIGVIGMKLIGEGAFTNREDRQKAMKFAFQQAKVDCVTVGYKSPAEIDEAIENVALALA